MRRTSIIASVGFPVASLLAATALDLSPYENQTIANILYILAVVVLLFVSVYWGIDWWRHRSPESKQAGNGSVKVVAKNHSTIENSPAVTTTGDDSSVTIKDSFNTNVEPLRHNIPWPKRPGGPEFVMQPGVEPYEAKLGCTFWVEANPHPGGMEAKWTGEGIEMDWAPLMLQNRERSRPNSKGYQMKPVLFAPNMPEVEIAFNVRFWLDDGQHGGKWLWYLQKGPRGQWEFDNRKGSGRGQPLLDNAW